MKGIILILIFFAMVGNASAAIVELSVSDIGTDGVGTMIIAYTGAVDSIVWVNFTGYSVPTIPLNGNGFVYEVLYIPCDTLITAEMYTGATLVSTDTYQRTDAGCNSPEVSFSQSVYSCDPTVQVNYQYAQNSTINIRELEYYANLLWSVSSVNGSGALYPAYNFTPGFSYLVEIQTVNQAGTFDTMDVQLCGSETDPDDPGGGTGDGDGDGGTGTGTGKGGTGSDGGTDPFTPPNSYDPTVPGQEWKKWIDLNDDGITSYAESLAAFRFWGFSILVGSYVLAGCKFGLGVNLW